MSTITIDTFHKFVTYLTDPETNASSVITLVGITSAIFGGLLGAFQDFLSKRHRVLKDRLTKELKLKSTFDTQPFKFEESKSEGFAKKIFSEVQEEIIRDASEQQGITKQFVTLEVEAKMGDLTTRLQAVESRLPNDSVIDNSLQ